MNQELLNLFISSYIFQPATAFWRAIEIDQLLQYPFPKGRGLDLGCGDGKLTAIIMNEVNEYSLVGIDLDPLETTQAKQVPIYNQVHTVPGDDIPEPSKSFDYVLSNSVLEHIPILDPIIEEVSRLLKGDGKFIFTVPSAGFRTCLRGSIFPWTKREDYLGNLDKRVAHYH